MFEQFGRLSQSAVKNLHIKSALNPILWLCAIVIPMLAWISMYFSKTPFYFISYAMTFLISLLIIVACGVFIYFAIKKPEKLQSEDYQLRHESIQWMQQKGGDLSFTPASVEQIINPAISQSVNKESSQ
ncbi:TPA: hypothetical protein J5T73_002552 [Enterobacter cloacae]|nr:hypothetical protein [Enterobacter cloacae]